MSGDPTTPPPEPTPEPIVPEVVPEWVTGGTRNFPIPCPGCLTSEVPHKDSRGRLGKGHTASTRGRERGSKNSTTVLAQKEMASATVMAVRVLIRQCRSGNEWIANSAARAILERGLPTKGAAVDEGGPVIVFPPGAKMSILAAPPEEPEAIARPRAALPDHEE